MKHLFYLVLFSALFTSSPIFAQVAAEECADATLIDVLNNTYTGNTSLYSGADAGWIQGSKNRDEIPLVAGLNGQHKFQGNIRLIEKGIVLQEQMFAKVNWPLRVQQIELDKFSAIINQKLLPFVVYLDKNIYLLGVKQELYWAVLQEIVSNIQLSLAYLSMFQHYALAYH